MNALPETAIEAQLRAMADLIRGHQRFIVAAHASPDGDAIGSTLGLAHMLRQLGKQVTAYNRDPVPYFLTFLPGSDQVVNDPGKLDARAEVFILLDCNALERADNKLKLDRSRTKLAWIDHHVTVEDDDPDVRVHDPSASAVGEILFRLLEPLGLALTREVATCLFASIQTDTGSFRYSNTTPEALHAAAALVGADVDVWDVSSHVYENHPVERVRLLAKVLETLTLSPDGKMAFLTVNKAMYKATGSGPEMIDGFINYARSIQGVEVAVQLREVNRREYRVSFRSRGRVNVASVAQQLGGGGHHNAAGCTVKGTVDEVIVKVTSLFAAELSS